MAERDFKLPDLDKTPADAGKTETDTGVPSLPVGSTTSTKEMVIAFGAVLVAAIIFFIVKNFLSRMLVSTQKKSPRTADTAGWSLFCILVLASITAALAILNSEKFLTLP